MSSVVLHITAGQGPRECRWVAAKLVEIFQKEAATAKLKSSLVDGDADDASFLLQIEGATVESFIGARTGSIRWIGQSPFRPNHKRKNWFVGVKPAPAVEDVPQLREQDIDYQAIRASGPGGQHVNKTDSAVRATHTPTGLSCVSQDQRSQFANKKIARLKLALMFEEQRELELGKSKDSMWSQNRELERGNEVRCYEGPKFKLRR